MARKGSRGSNRNRITFRWIPTDKDVAGNINYVKWYPLEESVPCQLRECSINDASSLLKEALYFYNYGISPSLLAPRKEKWKPFDCGTVKQAIEALYNVSYHSLYEMAKTLAETRHGTAVILPGQVNEKAKELFSKKKDGSKSKKIIIDTAQTGFLAASLWTSNEYRKEVTGSKVYFREFEKLPSVLKSLRELLDVSQIENMLQDQYRPFTDENLFLPFYGGSWTNNWPSHLLSPICKIGSTEKIYHDASLDIFKDRKFISQNIESDKLLDTVHKKINELFEIFPFYLTDRRLEIWQNWIDNLILLEEELCDRVNTKYFFANQLTSPGIIMGLPSAFAYIGALWVYIFDLMARTVMTAFCNVIYPIYRNINGYMAVQLWKALSGRQIPAATANLFCSMPKWLSSIYYKEVGLLKEFRDIPTKVLVKNVEVENVACNTFKEKLGVPIVKAKNFNKEKFYVRQIDKLEDDVEFVNWHKDYLPYYPVITSKFEEITGCVKPHKKDRLLYGVRFTAQVQIYMASQILRQGLHFSGVDKTERSLENFSIGAGSYIWGGKKQPHDTHRQGINIDLSFGPLIQRWLVPKKLHDALEKYIKTKNGKETIKNIVLKKRYDFLVSKTRSGRINIHYERLPRIVMICYTNEQEKSSTQRKMVVFEWIIKEKIFTVLRNVKLYCSKTIKDEAFNTIDEMEAYKKAEKVLTGLPHFSSADRHTKLQDWQRSHIAHLAILLTSPKYITFASPIIHLRAMRSIRKIFSEDGLFLFRINCTEDIVNRLNSIEKNIVPDIIRESFQAENMTLSMESIIMKKKEAEEWKIIDGENHFIVNKIKTKGKDEKIVYLEVRFQFPEQVLKLTAKVVMDTKFYFDPKKHYNHWHVDFYDEFYAKIVNQYRLGALLRTSITDIFLLQPIWLILGINLNPIIEYLKNNYVDKNIPSHLYNPSNERKNLLIKCKEYMKVYSQRFGNSLEKKTERQAQNEKITNIIKNSLFGLYGDPESEFIKPTLSKEGINNPVNFETIKDAVKKTREIIIALKQPLIEQGLLKEEDFNLFEGEELDKKDDAPDEERFA
ncbi:hypothetical protein [Hydrogenimonas sp.]